MYSGVSPHLWDVIFVFHYWWISAVGFKVYSRALVLYCLLWKIYLYLNGSSCCFFLISAEILTLCRASNRCFICLLFLFVWGGGCHIAMINGSYFATISWSRRQPSFPSLPRPAIAIWRAAGPICVFIFWRIKEKKWLWKSNGQCGFLCRGVVGHLTVGNISVGQSDCYGTVWLDKWTAVTVTDNFSFY